MSENFDFLRNWNNDLHYLAGVIEDEIYDSPSAVLSDATTFLEIIVYEIFKKYDLDLEKFTYFKDKVTALRGGGFISSDMAKNLSKAYGLRNKMHSYNGDIKNHLNLNKNRAVHIHKLLFNVSWLYYTEYCDDTFKTHKPPYTHPSRLKSKELDVCNCIICGKQSKDCETFCSECKYKIEKCDNIKTLRKHFGFKEGFKRGQLIELGFERGYVGNMLMELKNDGLIESYGTLNKINKEKTNHFIEEVEQMIAIEKLISDYKLKNITLKEISHHEYYLKGKNEEYPFVELYTIFHEKIMNEFNQKMESSNDINEVIKEYELENNDLNEWYFAQNIKGLNEKLIDNLIKGTELNLTSEITDSIKNTREYREKDDQYRFSQFLKYSMQEKVTKEDALKKAGLSEGKMESMLRLNPELNVKFNRLYTKRKMERFLKHFDYYNYDYALKKTGLLKEELERCLKNNAEYREKFERICVEKYVSYRKNGNTRLKASKKLGKVKIEKLLEKYDNDLNKFLSEKTAELINEEKSKDEIIKILDVTPDWLDESIKTNKDVYDVYKSEMLPNQLEKFIELIHKKPLKSVMNELNINQEELDFWYKKGKENDETFEKFYSEFFEFKKQTYIKAIMKKQKIAKALKKSYLTKEELEENDCFENEIEEKSIEIISDELQKGNTTKEAVRKTPFAIRNIYDWIRHEIDGNENYKDFYEIYRRSYLNPIRKAYEDGIKEGLDEKLIIKAMKKSQFLVDEDVRQLKLLDLFPKPEDITVEFESDSEEKTI